MKFFSLSLNNLTLDRGAADPAPSMPGLTFAEGYERLANSRASTAIGRSVGWPK